MSVSRRIAPTTFFMAIDPGSQLHSAALERVLFLRDSAGVVLYCGGKRFMIFVGTVEARAIQRELALERTDRPLTHDVISYVLTGFDITVKKVIISSILHNVFCATLVLSQDRADQSSNEVRLDIRASDCLVIALKTKSQIWVTQRVLDDVEDVTDTLRQIDDQYAAEDDDA